MNKLLFITLIYTVLFLFTSCEKEEDLILEKEFQIEKSSSTYTNELSKNKEPKTNNRILSYQYGGDEPTSPPCDKNGDGVCDDKDNEGDPNDVAEGDPVEEEDPPLPDPNNTDDADDIILLDFVKSLGGN